MRQKRDTLGLHLNNNREVQEMKTERFLGRTDWQISEVSLGGAYLMGNDPERAQDEHKTKW